jgi:hypothetical protein
MSQLKLFRPELASRPEPDLAYTRKSLHRLLRIAREAEILPWSEAETQSWEKLFPQLAAALPAEEAVMLTSEFTHQLARLRETA